MDKQIKQIQRFIIMIMVLLFAAAVSFSLIVKKDSQDLLTKELKISSLIDEVGELKDQNIKLSTKVDAKNQVLVNINSQIAGLGKDINIIGGDKQTFSKAAAEISSLQKQLTIALTDKEKKISRLAVKNTELKNELQSAAEIEKLKTKNYLIVGTNMQLTDAIIIASVNVDTQKITLISIPRDFYYKGRKINELFFRYGIGKLEEALSDITALKIDKYAILDFEAFVKLIDEIGGVDVNVAKKIVDNAYPGPNRSYLKISFNAGFQHMDGDTALKYARSRESTSDFDRSRRQQQIIQTVAEKLKNMDLSSKLDLASSLYNDIIPYLKTDIGLFDGIGDYGSYKDYAMSGGHTIDTSNYLYSTHTDGGQYILLPKKGNYSEIKAFILKILQE